MSNIEVRKLPKRTIIIITLIFVFGLAGYLFISYTKELKMKEVLATLDFKNVSNITVYNVAPVKNDETNKSGYLYKLSFKNNENNQECVGLIFRENGKYKKDIDCK